MESWVVSGLSQDQLRRRVVKGEIFKIARGLYARRKPEPIEVAQLLHQRWPKVMIAGKSAVEIYSRTAMTLPLEVAYTNRLSSSEWFKAQRTRQRTFYEFKGIPVQNPILAALEVDEKRAITMLEFHYRSVRGKAALERDLYSISRVPAGTKEMLSKVVHGSDSEAERLVVRALRRRGMKVETNRQIGPYFWDIVVGKSPWRSKAMISTKLKTWPHLSRIGGKQMTQRLGAIRYFGFQAVALSITCAKWCNKS